MTDRSGLELESKIRFLAASKLRVRRDSSLASEAVWGCWMTGLIALGVVLVWAFNDGRFGEAARWVGRDPQSLRRAILFQMPQEPTLAKRVRVLRVVCGVALVSAGAIFIGLFVGPARHRGLRSWFGLTLLVACWLTLWSTWPEVVWRGQAYRF